MLNKPPKKPALALDTQLVSDNMPLEVLPKLYIGSVHASFNLDAMQELGITHILNCSRLPANFSKQFIYLNIDIRDKDDSNILSCIPIANIFIEAGMGGGGVLVHCIGGRSRSAAFIAGYLMSSSGYSYDNALTIITCARPVASINRGFEIQLRAYAQNKYDVYLAQQILIRSRIRALHNLRGSKSSIETISASIDASNMKLLNSNRAQRKLSDEVRIVAPNSISKPINRSSFSPVPDHNINLSINRDNNDQSMIYCGSGQKRTWLDSSHGNDNVGPYSKHHDMHIHDHVAPEQDQEANLNMMLSSPSSKLSVKNLNHLMSIDVKHDIAMEANTLLSTCGSISISAYASRSNSRSSSFVYNIHNQGRDLDDDSGTYHNLNDLSVGASSRRNSLTSHALLKDPSIKILQDISSSPQSFILPKIITSRSPSISDTSNNPGVRQKGSRKNSLDPSILSPSSSSIIMPALEAIGRSKSLFPPASDTLLQSPISTKSKTSATHHSIDVDSINYNSNNSNFLAPLLTSSSRKGSNYALDTSDIPGISKDDEHSNKTLPKPDSFHIIGNKSSMSELPYALESIRSPIVDSISSLRTPQKPTLQPLSSAVPSTCKSSVTINMNSYNDSNYNDIMSEYDVMKESETPTPNYSEHTSRRGSKGKGEAGGYQSIIREYIPLFESKTPNIRYSRPGMTAVRVIPPLRGLDKAYCCAWCGTNLFSLANVVKVDFDSAAVTRAGGFDILPIKEEHRKLVHIPTSTTNKTAGLFMRKQSIDMTAAMINGHKSLIQTMTGMPPPTPGSKPKPSLSSDDNNMMISPSKPDHQSSIDDDDDKDSDAFASMNDQVFGESKMSFKPLLSTKFVPPPSTRSRQTKAFSFNDSNDQPTSSINEPIVSSTIFSPSASMDQKNISIPSVSEKHHLISSLPLTTMHENTFSPTSDKSSVSSASVSPSVSHGLTVDSPRIILPPPSTTSSYENKSLSVEKKRWLDRVNLLKSEDDNSNHRTLSAIADADEVAQFSALFHDTYIFLEYLEWMGVDCFKMNQDVGEISCHSCKKAIGSWTWTPSDRQTMNGKLENPIFRIHRHVVYQSDFVLDVTPLSTPKAGGKDNCI